MSMTMRSPSFHRGGRIPRRYTCEGEGLSPALSWSGVPRDARSLVLIVEDPDVPDPEAPEQVRVHWLVYNIPPTAKGLAEGRLPAGALQGQNDWGEAGYRGPCPETGKHHHLFRLIALDVHLPVPEGLSRAELEEQLQHHLLEQTEIVGTYRPAGEEAPWWEEALHSLRERVRDLLRRRRRAPA